MKKNLAILAAAGLSAFLMALVLALAPVLAMFYHEPRLSWVAAAIGEAIRMIGPGDIVLLAGKGHELDLIAPKIMHQHHRADVSWLKPVFG